MDLNSILTIVGIVVLLGIAGGCVFAILKLKQLLDSFDSKIVPELDKLKATTESLKTVAAQADDIMGKANIALDSLNVELVNADDKLAQLAALTGKVTDASEAAGAAKNNVKGAVKARLGK